MPKSIFLALATVFLSILCTTFLAEPSAAYQTDAETAHRESVEANPPSDSTDLDVSGEITENTIWSGEIVVTGGVHVQAGITLTVEAGTDVRFDGLYGIDVDGTLDVNGADGNEVVFTSNQASPSPLDWSGIVFASGGSGSLEYARISYGGYSVDGEVEVRSDNVTISYSEISFSDYGIFVYGASPTISENTFTDITTSGVRCSGGGAPDIDGNDFIGGTHGVSASGDSLPQITGNTFTGQTSWPVTLDMNSSIATISGNTYVSVKEGIQITAGTLTTSGSWGTDAPYVVSAIVTIGSGTTLTLEPAAIVKSYGTIAFKIQGALVADGTPSEPITITSLRDDSVGGDTNGDGSATSPAPRDWGWLEFQGTSSGTIDNAIIRYGGTYGVGQIEIKNTDNVTVTYSDISYSDDGIWAYNASSTFSNNTFNGNIYRGLFVENGSPSISGNDFTDNGDHGIFVENGSPTITGNTFTGNGASAIHCTIGGAPDIDGNDITGGSYGVSASSGALPVVTGNTFTGQTSWPVTLDMNSSIATFSGNTYGSVKEGIEVTAGTLTTSGSWGDELPYVVAAIVTIGNGTTLTLDAGAIIKSYGTIAFKIKGALSADGTPSEPVTITSLRDDSAGGDTNGDGSATTPSPTDWGWLEYQETSSGTLNNAIIRYGGTYGVGQIEAKSSGVTVTNSQIDYSDEGISVHAGSPVISNNTFNANSNSGIKCMYSSTPEISGNTFQGGNYGIQINDTSLPDLGGGALASTGGNQFLGYTGGSDWAVFNGTSQDTYAKNNWWGFPTPAQIDAVIYDKKDNAAHGEVFYDDYWPCGNGDPCDDGEYCNGTDTCLGGTCSEHSGDPCTDDGLFCNGTEYCDEIGDACLHTGFPCESGWICEEETDQCLEGTGVELVSFEAHAALAGVVLSWETASEIDNAGFHLWRRVISRNAAVKPEIRRGNMKDPWTGSATQASSGTIWSPEKKTLAGAWKRITDSLIASQGTPISGALYQFVDRDVADQAVYDYKLEEVDLYGRSAFHGPVRIVYATPIHPAARSARADSNGRSASIETPLNEPSAWPEGVESPDAIVWEYPEDIRVTALPAPDYLVIEADEQAMTIEILVPDCDLVEAETAGGIERFIEIEGFDLTGEPGYPRLPMKVLYIELPEGAYTAQAGIVESEVEVRSGTYLIPEGIAADDSRTQDVNRAVPFAIDGGGLHKPIAEAMQSDPVPAIGALEKGCYPGFVLLQGEVVDSLLPLILLPVQWMEEHSEEMIEFHRRLIVRIEY